MKRINKYTVLSILWFLLGVFCLLNVPSQAEILARAVEGAQENVPEITYVDFMECISTGSVETVYVQEDDAWVYLYSNNTFYKTMNPTYDAFKKDMLLNSVKIGSDVELHERLASHYDVSVIPTVLMFLFPVIAAFVLSFLCHKTSRRNVMATNGDQFPLSEVSSGLFNDASHNTNGDGRVYALSDVAGLHEVKRDIACLIDFLKNKTKYTSAGAKLPKGVIFQGPPGTGKTLLAKAIAGEAGVPFLYASGADFVEMYVGVGAKRIRKLFDEARKKPSCIIFIDEIDAIGPARQSRDANGEDRKTINALLAEMDGFKSSDNILVIGATNTIDSLDPALLRPGRFTNKYSIPLPSSAEERMEVLSLYVKNKNLAADVNLMALAKETSGFSPASLEYLINEAAIISVQKGKPSIDRECIDVALTKAILSGHIKDSQAGRDAEELKTVAWHEAGHALVGKLIGKSVPKVTILASTTGAGGITFSTPKKESGIMTLTELQNEVMQLYAGRVAERMLRGDTYLTTGASNDIEKATHVIHAIVTSFGMSDEYGLLNLKQLGVSQDVILKREVSLAKEMESKVTTLLSEHASTLTRIAEALIQQETLHEDELDAIMYGTTTSGSVFADDMEEMPVASEPYCI
jgi:cell division protease FtsH